MAYDAARGNVLLFGGYDISDNNDETWEYDGATSTWTGLTPTAANTPSPRTNHAVAYDAARGNVVLFGGFDGSYYDETWTFQHRAADLSEVCHLGFDADGDGLIGCADPDCWGLCTPLCPPYSSPGWPADCSLAAPHCGDGACNSFLEPARLCEADCGVTLVCGDFHCDVGEDLVTCPGDCAL